MKERYVDLDGAWGVLLCYDYTRRDYDRIHAIMQYFGRTEYKII